MFWNVKTWQLHSGHWRYWETRAKVQELTFWGHFKMKWILISNSKQYIWPFFCSNECQGWARCPQSAAVQGPEAMYYTSVSCLVVTSARWPHAILHTILPPPSSPQPVNQDTINGPSYNSGHAEARYFIVSCSGRKCDEDRDTSSVWRGVNTGL